MASSACDIISTMSTRITVFTLTMSTIETSALPRNTLVHVDRVSVKTQSHNHCFTPRGIHVSFITCLHKMCMLLMEGPIYVYIYLFIYIYM